MCADIIIAQGYEDVVLVAPRGGSDRGMDITFRNQRGERGLACVTLREDIMVKFKEDFSDALPKRRGRPLRSAPKPCVRLVASHGSSRMQSVVTDTPCRVWHAFGRGNVGEERTCC